ncbi:MAG: ATP-dependent helicase, partial [Eubacteriales bacterium]
WKSDKSGRAEEWKSGKSGRVVAIERRKQMSRNSNLLSFDDFKAKYMIELNPQQERAVRKTDGPALLLAVPGSGKTTVITTRVAYLIYCKGVPPERILTLTFSRAAAAEMKQRFLKKFGGAGTSIARVGLEGLGTGNAGVRPGESGIDKAVRGRVSASQTRAKLEGLDTGNAGVGLGGSGTGNVEVRLGRAGTGNAGAGLGGAGSVAERARFSTIHSFCYWVIRRYATRCGYRIPELITDNSQLIRRLCLSVYHQKADETAINQLAQYIGFCKNRITDPIQLEDISFDDMDFRRLYEAYEDTLQQNGLMDFDDLLRMVDNITDKYPHILEELQSNHIYINIDEAQDNSSLQHRIIRKISSAPHQRLFMVGDEDQSIYGFRAAYPEALTSFRKECPGAEILLIETNYRCCTPVAEVAQRVISQNHNRYHKEMKTVQDKGSVKRKKLSDSSKQYRYLFGELKRLARSGKRAAVLYRNNSSGVPLFDMLFREGLPFSGAMDSEFFSHRVVRDFICALRLAMNPRDIDAYSKIYWKMGLGTTKTQFVAVASDIKRGVSGSIFELLAKRYVGVAEAMIAKKVDRSANVVRRKDAKGINSADIIQFGEDMELIGRMHPYNAVEEVNRLFLGNWFSLQAKRGLQSATAVEERLLALLALASEQKSIQAFLERLSGLEALCSGERGNIQSEAITVATIHQSKGMEFDKVFIIDLFRGVFPSENSAGVFSLYGGDIYEEEVRLLYVALTRARYDVEIVTSGRRYGREREISPFVDLVFGSYSSETSKKSCVERVKTMKSRMLGVKGLSEVSESPDSPELSDYAQVFQPGTRVVHKYFGAGTIKNRIGDTLSIRFDDGEDKRMLLSACLEWRYLKCDIDEILSR